LGEPSASALGVSDSTCLGRTLGPNGFRTEDPRRGLVTFEGIPPSADMRPRDNNFLEMVKNVNLDFA